VHIRRKHFGVAKVLFYQGYEIIRQLQPSVTIQRGAFLYKIGVCEMETGHYESAVCDQTPLFKTQLVNRDCRKHFDEAIGIAKEREIDGEKARALRMKSRALKSGEGVTGQDADASMEEAERIRRKYLGNREFPSKTEDQIYDLMICGQRR